MMSGRPMKGVRGTFKGFGDKCATCRKILSPKNGVPRVKPRNGLYSYCRECLNQRSREYSSTHREQVAERNRIYRKKLRDVVLRHYGAKCACCGETHREFLAIDHIKGGGTKLRKIAGYYSTASMARQIIQQGFPKTLRILCHNCNLALGFYGRCPHAGA